MPRTLRRNFRMLRFLAVAGLAMSLGGCAWMFNEPRSGRGKQSSTPLVDFLYADGKVPDQDAQPELRLPIRVAVSFLPVDGSRYFQPAAVEREQVLKTLREHFKTLPY